MRYSGPGSGTPARLASAIAEAIARKLKVEVPVIVKSAQELSAIVAENPVRVDAGGAFALPGRIHAGAGGAPRILRRSSRSSSRPNDSRSASTPPTCTAHDGILKSKAGEALLGKTGRRATTRNFATTLKLLALAEKAG